MQLLGDAFDSIGSLRTLLLTDDFILGGNNTFATVFSTFRTRAGDKASFFGAPEIAEKLKGPELQNALQQRISFVKRTKEEIFDDPRLSDKDLAYHLQIVGLGQTTNPQVLIANLKSFVQDSINSVDDVIKLKYNKTCLDMI